jgi:hypothetical protein
MAGTIEGARKAQATRAAKRAAQDTPEAPSPVSGGLETRSKPREVFYVVGRKPIKHGKRTFQPGEYFPVATRLPRLESWLRTGMLVQR